MFRVIHLIKRKAGTTPQQFRAYYESTHAPLGVKFINGHALSYSRHFLSPMESGGPEPVYDAVMQMCFADRAAHDRCMSLVANNPESAKLFVDDEARFLDRDACLNFESQDSCSKLQELPASDKIFRTVWFARRRSGMTHEQCRAYYENKHRLLGEYMMNGYAYNYDRHFLYKMTPNAAEPPYTFVMEMNFPSRETFEKMGAAIVGDPTVLKLVGEDEERFIDRSSAVHYAAEMCTSALAPVALVSAA